MRDTRIVIDKGLQIGKNLNLIVDEESGKLGAFVIEPKEISGVLHRGEGGKVLAPSSFLLAVRNYILISERELALQMSKPYHL